LALFVATPFLFGCTQVSQPILATGISLSETSKSLTYDPDAQVKESFTLTATVTPSNYNHGTITWDGGKHYDDVYVILTPSEDGKTCKVTANKVITEGVNVYARIQGDGKEYNACCEVKVLKKKVHATAIEFTDTTAKTIKVLESASVGYTVTPSENDDTILAKSSDTNVVTAIANTQTKQILITAKGAGTATITLSCWDDDTKKCESTTSLSVTVEEPTSLNYTLGSTAVNKLNNVKTDVNAVNIYSISPSSNVVLQKLTPMSLKVTPKDGTAVDLNNCNCTIGLMKKGTQNWIFLGMQSSATYESNDAYTLEAGQVYYVKVTNNAALASASFDIHVTMPAAK